jgi:protein required for attachment to host cells
MSMKLGIVTADGARARYITAEVSDDIDLEGNPRLVEHGNVVNPLGVMPARETFGDRPSRKPSGGGPRGALPATDDHRDGHAAEDERRYVADVVAGVSRFSSEKGIVRLILAAGPRLLGVLRTQLGSVRSPGLELVELPLDLSSKSLPQIRDALVQRGLLPEPELPRGSQFRPRGQQQRG